jgi:hypothetical protein
MANITNESNHLKIKMNSKKTKMIVWGLLCLGDFLYFYICIRSRRTPSPIAMPLFFLFGLMTNINHKEYSKLESGLNGEESALEILNGLGSEYTVISDIEIEYEGRKSQIDSVIVGANGVFVMETKNVRGYVVGKEQDHDIIIHKVGRRGGEYSNSLYNPCKQVGTHVFRLSKVLQQNGLNPWVQGLVFFSNPVTEVEIESSKIPVFNYADAGDLQINSYISNYKGQPINTENQKKIIDILTQYILNK